MFHCDLAVFVALSLTARIVTAAPMAALECDRATLLAVADSYVSAQTFGKLDFLRNVLVEPFQYQENNKGADIRKGVLSLALKIDSRRSTVDTTACATYTELISTDVSKPYVIGTQIRHNPETLAVIMVDTIASTTNSWVFNATKTLDYVQQEDWSVLPEERRSSREVLKAAADAYLDMWSSETAMDTVPWGTPCTRLEGSAYTGQGLPTDSCQVGLPTNNTQAPNSNRRYVIDETVGSCSVLCVWEHMMNAADSHEFRLEDGKLRYVHTMTVCPGTTCRL
jgi:hypothetical protein